MIQLSPIQKPFAKFDFTQLKIEEISIKVHRFVMQTSLEFLKGNFFSSKQFYQCSQVALISIGFIGSAQATILLMTGMTATSLITMFLSCGIFIGAYMAHQAIIQQTFAETAEQFQNNNINLKNEVSRLTEQLGEFQIKLLQFSDLSTNFVKDMQQLEKLSETNSSIFQSRIQKFSDQISSFHRLWEEILEEKKNLTLEFKDNLETLKQLIRGITDPQAVLIKIEELKSINLSLKETIKELICAKEELSKIKTQITIREDQIRERDEILKQLQIRFENTLLSYNHENGFHKKLNEDMLRVIEKFKNT